MFTIEVNLSLLTSCACNGYNHCVCDYRAEKIDGVSVYKDGIQVSNIFITTFASDHLPLTFTFKTAFPNVIDNILGYHYVDPFENVENDEYVEGMEPSVKIPFRVVDPNNTLVIRSIYDNGPNTPVAKIIEWYSDGTYLTVFDDQSLPISNRRIVYCDVVE